MKLKDLFATIEGARLSETLAEQEVTGITVDSRDVTKGMLFIAVSGTTDDGRNYIASALEKGAVAAVVEEKLGVRSEELEVGNGEIKSREIVDVGRLESTRDECNKNLKTKNYQLKTDVLATQPLATSHSFLISVPDIRSCISKLSARFYGYPDEKVKVFGVTGTNGKTTVATVLQSILQASGTSCGLISTVTCMLGKRDIPATHTTPDATTVYRYLAEMRDAGYTAASLEVSSHALDQGRVTGLRFAVAGFTNLTQDHLDYHGTMECYGEAKRKLFTQLVENGGTAVINIDDAFGRTLAKEFKGKIPVMTYSVENPSADIRAEDVRLSVMGTQFTLRVNELGIRNEELGIGNAQSKNLKSKIQNLKLETPMLGKHNISNVLCAAGMAMAAGVSLDVIAKALATIPPVRGRLERVINPKYPHLTAFVDYAHTPDALERVIRTLRESVSRKQCAVSSSDRPTTDDRLPLTAHRLLVVFGCGGNRDRGKRPKMGKVVAELADIAVVTSDNPRKEAPVVIIHEILVGMKDIEKTSKVKIIVEEDRATAIAKALTLATKDGDILLVAGKGHETSQVFADTTIHFDDREELLR